MGGLLVNGKELSRSEVDKILSAYIKAIPCVKIDVAGSYRRGKQLGFKDVDIVIIPNAITRQFIHSNFKVLKYGDKQINAEIGGIQFDFYFTNETSWGACLLRRTGSAGYSIGYAVKCKNNGWTFNDNGIFDSSGQQLAGNTEESIYALFGKEWKEPKLRGL